MREDEKAMDQFLKQLALHTSIQLSIDSSSHPGNSWSRWLCFKPLTHGFSLLAWGSGAPSKRSMRIARRYVPLTWRSACQTLLNLAEIYLLDGDYRGEVQVEGVEGWKADLLSMCWFGDSFYRYREALGYVVNLPDEELRQLIKSLPDGVDSNSTLNLIADLVDTFGNQESLSSICGGRELISVDCLRSKIQNGDLRYGEECAARERKKTQGLSPFKTSMDNVIALEIAKWGPARSYGSSHAVLGRKAKLSRSLEGFVLEHERLPTDGEWAIICANARNY
jgi:hypothetical protein